MFPVLVRGFCATTSTGHVAMMIKIQTRFITVLLRTSDVVLSPTMQPEFKGKSSCLDHNWRLARVQCATPETSQFGISVCRAEKRFRQFHPEMFGARHPPDSFTEAVISRRIASLVYCIRHIIQA
jgi:hypothetical protein